MQGKTFTVTWKGVNKIHSGVAIAKKGDDLVVVTGPDSFVLVHPLSVLSCEENHVSLSPLTPGGNPGD